MNQWGLDWKYGIKLDHVTLSPIPMEEYERAKRRREEEEEEERKREEEERKQKEEEVKRMEEEERKRKEEANVMNEGEKEAQAEEFIGEQKSDAENLSTTAQDVELRDDGVEEKDWSRLMEVEQELVDLRDKP